MIKGYGFDDCQLKSRKTKSNNLLKKWTKECREIAKKHKIPPHYLMTYNIHNSIEEKKSEKVLND
jgi:hypothetical protein